MVRFALVLVSILHFSACASPACPPPATPTDAELQNRVTFVLRESLARQDVGMKAVLGHMFVWLPRDHPDAGYDFETAQIVDGVWPPGAWLIVTNGAGAWWVRPSGEIFPADARSRYLHSLLVLP